MKKNLNSDKRSKISECLKKAATLIQALTPLIDEEVSDAIGKDAMGGRNDIFVIRTMLSAAWSQLDEAKKIVEAG